MTPVLARHFTIEGKHFYRLFASNEQPFRYASEFETVLADGERLSKFVDRCAPRQVVPFVEVDHEVKQWSVRQFNKRWYYTRTEAENPFRFDLPDGFDGRAELCSWWVSASGQSYDEDLLGTYYSRKYESTEIEPLPVEVNVQDLGEWTPAPKVWFGWEVCNPWAYKEPEELQHLYPCAASGANIREALKPWLVENKERLGIKEHYLDQSGGTVYFVDRTSVNTGRFFEGERAGNLCELTKLMDKRLEEAKQYIESQAATAKCPYCQGSGRRMEQAGISALTADIIAEVRYLRTTKNRSRVDKIADMVARLGVVAQ